MRSATLIRALRSTRVRAGLALGVVAAVGTTGTFAFWTDSVTIAGQTLTSGTIDLQAGATAASTSDPFTTTTLTSQNMLPGSTVAQTLVLKNAGNVPLKWTLTGGLTGTDAKAFSDAGTNGLLLTITDGNANGGTCSGNVVASVSGVALTNVPATPIISARQATIPGGGTAGLCLQVKLSDGAPQGTLAGGKVAIPTFTFTGTSDVS